MILEGYYSGRKLKWKKEYQSGILFEKRLYSEDGKIEEVVSFSEESSGLAEGIVINYDSENLSIKNINYNGGYPKSDYRKETELRWDGFNCHSENSEDINGVNCSKIIVYEENCFIPIEQRYYAEKNIQHGKWIRYYLAPDPYIITLEEIEKAEKHLQSEIEVTYDMGEVKEIRSYSEKGGLLYKGNFQDGKLLRDVEYNEDGVIIYRSYFKGGNYHQEINEYDEDGKFDFTMSFINGEEVEEMKLNT